MADIKCAVCGKQKNQLYSRNSAIDPSVTLLICGSCMTEKYEPRWLIILKARELVANKQDLGVIKVYLKKHRYVGDEIPANSLVN